MNCRRANDSGRRRLPRRDGSNTAFTLIEVMVATAVLVISLASILLLVSTGIRTARILDRVHVDASSVAGELSLTNRLEEGVESGDFGDAHPGYGWTRTITEAGTNGLFRVDFVVSGGGEAESRLSVLLFRPGSVSRRGLPQ
jgi:hypothetical protein